MFYQDFRDHVPRLGFYNRNLEGHVFVFSLMQHLRSLHGQGLHFTNDTTKFSRIECYFIIIKS